MKNPSYAIALDFCDTVTTTKTIKWADDRLLGKSGIAEMQAIRERLLPKLEAGTITEQEMDDWTFRTFEIYAQERVTREQVVNAIRGLPLRDGLNELLQWARIMGIPVAIISGSCADFIDIALGNAGLRHLVTHVHATQLTYNEDLVTGAQRDTMVTNHNKGAWAKAFADKIGIPTRRLIGVGDSNNDLNLAGEDGHLIGITATEQASLKLKPRFNKVVVSPSLEAALMAIKQHVEA